MMCERPWYPPGSSVLVPCRQCLLCKIARSSEWAIRMSHERLCHAASCYVTLTYSEDKLPAGLGLNSEHFSGFMKRLRKLVYPRRVRYFACGEYGDKQPEIYYLAKYGRPFGRPHFHAILFGISIEEHLVAFVDIDDPSQGFKCLRGVVKDAWKLGNVSMGTVTMSSARYVSDYLHKQVNGPLRAVRYGDLVQPFQRVSQGIGRDWAIANQERLLRERCLTIGGKRVKLPRYYVKLLFEEGSEEQWKLRSDVIEAKQELYERLGKRGVEGLEVAKEEYIFVGRQKRKNVKFFLDVRGKPAVSPSLD